jgi:predicted metal-dependent hydrolase
LREGPDIQIPELRVSGGSDHIARRVRDWLKKYAKNEVTYKATKFSNLLNKKIKKVSVRDTRTRWGSCSSRGNLSFSWRLIFAPERIVDYVCAHEAAHLVELNHSPRFWKLVYQLVGEWESSKEWLRKNGARLHRYG